MHYVFIIGVPTTVLVGMLIYNSIKSNRKLKKATVELRNYKLKALESLELIEDYKKILVSSSCVGVYLTIAEKEELEIVGVTTGWTSLFNSSLTFTPTKESILEAIKINKNIINKWKTSIFKAIQINSNIGPIEDTVFLCDTLELLREVHIKYYIDLNKVGEQLLIKVEVIDETEKYNSIRISDEKEELARILLQMTTHQIKNKARTVSLLLEELESKQNQFQKLSDEIKSYKNDIPIDLLVPFTENLHNLLDDKINVNLKGKTKEILNLTDYIAKLCNQNLMKIDNKIINLNTAVSKAIATLNTKDVEIDYNLRYCINGDNSLIVEVFIELLSNSIKYNKNTNLKIEITAEEAIICGQKVLKILIEDNGIGIPQDKLDIVLNPYIRLNPEIEGTGLGLTFVKQILRRHDAKILLQNRVGGGLSVSLLFKGGYIEKRSSCSE